MRKLFWTCMTGGVLLAGGVISTAYFAVQHPESFVARVLNGASYAAAIVNPVSGLSQVVAQARHDNPVEGEEAAETETVPTDPVQVPDENPVPGGAPLAPLAGGEELSSRPAEPGPIEVAGTGIAPIVIPEEEERADRTGAGNDVHVGGDGNVRIWEGERAVGSVHMPMPETLCPAQHTGPCDSATEYPAGAVASAAPTTMPYCQDEEQSETLPMPASEEEMLPMPSEEEEQDAGQGEMNLDAVIIEAVLRCVKEANGCKHDAGTSEQPAEPEAPVQCPESSYHHHHESVCPYSGKSYPTCPDSEPCKPSSPAASPATPGSEESSEPGTKEVRRKLSIFRTHSVWDEGSPKHPEVDTMEFRASDWHLYDYGPGSL